MLEREVDHLEQDLSGLHLRRGEIHVASDERGDRAGVARAVEVLDRHGLGAFWWSVTRIGLPSGHDGDPLDLDRR